MHRNDFVLLVSLNRNLTASIHLSKPRYDVSTCGKRIVDVLEVGRLL